MNFVPNTITCMTLYGYMYMYMYMLRIRKGEGERRRENERDRERGREKETEGEGGRRREERRGGEKEGGSQTTHPLTLLLPVFLSLGHGLDAVREGGQNTSRRRFERDRLSTKVDIVHINGTIVVWSATTYGGLDVRMIVAILVSTDARGDGFGKGERVTAGSTVALRVLEGGAVCEWRGV